VAGDEEDLKQQQQQAIDGVVVASVLRTRRGERLLWRGPESKNTH